jgi:penicillin-binding protein 1B
VAFVMTNMLEGVLNFGTAFGVRQRGFTAPAAGKTGTSHDGWFAGYTSNLLCIVWVGYDDYSDIRLSGAQTAAPVWAEFMKKAMALPQYSDVKPFRQPDGVVDVQLDKATNRLATPTCPDDYTIAFVAGTEPHDTCDQPNGLQGFFSRIFGGTSDKQLPPSTTNGQTNNSGTNGNPDQAVGVQPQQEPKKKKGFFGKIADAFRGDNGHDKKDDDKNTPAESKPPANGATPPP